MKNGKKHLPQNSTNQPVIATKKLAPGNAQGCFEEFHIQFDPRLGISRSPLITRFSFLTVATPPG